MEAVVLFGPHEFAAIARHAGTRDRKDVREYRENFITVERLTNHGIDFSALRNADERKEHFEEYQRQVQA